MKLLLFYQFQQPAQLLCKMQLILIYVITQQWPVELMEVILALGVVQQAQQLLQQPLLINGSHRLIVVHGGILLEQYHNHMPPLEILHYKQDLKELHLLIMMQMGMEFLMNQFHVAEQIQIL